MHPAPVDVDDLLDQVATARAEPDHYLSTEQEGGPVINGRNIFADAVTAAYTGRRG